MSSSVASLTVFMLPSPGCSPSSPLSLSAEAAYAHLQARHIAVPRGVALRVLGGNASRSAVRAPENDRARDLPGGHVERLCRGVDYLVDGLHGEVEGHELADGPQAGEGRSHRDPRESGLPRNNAQRAQHAGSAQTERRAQDSRGQGLQPGPAAAC
jgi:hypothetical protein